MRMLQKELSQLVGKKKGHLERSRRSLRCEPLEDRRVLAVVSSLADAGPGTLRDALAGPDASITFSVSGTINLASELVVNRAVTIDGTGQNVVVNAATIAGGGRSFNVDDGLATNVNVTIRALRVQGGNVPNAAVPNSGGGIRNAETLTLENSTVSGNAASSGGGLSVVGTGSLTSTGNTFQNNAAIYNGGAISVGPTASATLTNNTISNNTAGTNNTSATFSSFGGGIQSSGSLTITGGSITGNTARHTNFTTLSGIGGAIATTSVTDAMGVLTGGGTTTVTGTSITGNRAELGGAMSGGSLTTTTLNNASVNNNDAGFDIAIPANAGAQARGGGLYFSGSQVANGMGGFARNIVTLTINGGTINNNRALNGATNATSNFGIGGGALFGVNAVVNATGTTVQGNTAFDDGGGIFTTNFGVPAGDGAFSTVNLSGVTVRGNTLPNSLNQTVAPPAAIFPYGAGLSQQVNVTTTISGGSVFEDNVVGSGVIGEAGNARGGGIYAGAFINGGPNRSSTIILDGATIRNNRTQDDSAFGAGLQLSQGAVGTVRNSTFIGNSAVGGDGGAIGLLFGSKVTVEDSRFEANTATSDAGGIRALVGNAATFNASELTVRRSTFLNNVSGFDGGAISSASTIDLIENSSFFGNVADNDGGAIWTSQDPAVEPGTNIVINFSTFTGNTANIATGSGVGGGGIAQEGAVFTMTNSIVAGNTATANIGTDLAQRPATPGVVLFSLVESPNNNVANLDASNLVGVSPNLGAITTSGRQSFRVPNAGSPVIGTADPAATLATDQRGFGRPGGNATRDRGSIESDGTAPVPPLDFNGDTRYDCGDMDLLAQAIVNGGPLNPYDVDGNGSVGTSDVFAWLTQAGALRFGPGRSFRPGDANLDGVVDGGDFGVWNSNKFTSTRRWCAGDFNQDGVVDGGDFGIWNSNKFTASDALRLAGGPAVGGGVEGEAVRAALSESSELRTSSSKRLDFDHRQDATEAVGMNQFAMHPGEGAVAPTRAVLIAPSPAVVETAFEDFSFKPSADIAVAQTGGSLASAKLTNFGSAATGRSEAADEATRDGIFSQLS